MKTKDEYLYRLVCLDTLEYAGAGPLDTPIHLIYDSAWCLAYPFSRSRFGFREGMSAAGSAVRMSKVDRESFRV
jgi:hypothetical protein